MNIDAIPYARKVYEHLLAHPEEHDQGTFGKQTSACGTTACIAGTAVLMSPDPQDMAGLAWKTLCGGVFLVNPNNNDASRVGYHAQRLLGLSTPEAQALFSAGPSNAEALELLKSYIDDAQAREAALA